jgi:hypothetical protein
MEFIKKLTGEQHGESAHVPPESIILEYQMELEETVKEGKIPYEHADMVRDYFLFIGFIESHRFTGD